MHSSRFHLLFAICIAATSIFLIIAFGYSQRGSESIISTEDTTVFSGTIKDATGVISQTGSNEKVETNTIDVVYTSSGYTPDNILITSGSIVRFINTTNIGMWTASDPHPVHSDYSPFDSRRNYQSGEVYEYKFDTTGTYGFHNHNKSLHRGVVRVYDPKVGYIDISKTLPGGRKKRDELLSILDAQNPLSIGILIRTIEKDSKLSRDCHDMAHDLGHRSYELFGFSRALVFDGSDPVAMTSVDDICAGGYMHGVLEELFLNRPELVEQSDHVCDGVSIDGRGSCFHGVGHGIMFSQKRDLKKSLESCNKLSSTVDAHRCYEGVYMELFWGETGHADGKLYWNTATPLAPCAQAGSEDAPACYLYAHLGYMRTHPGDFDGALKLCLDAPNEFGQRFCIKGIGITMMKHFSSKHLDKTESIVKDLTYAQKTYYYEGVAGYSLLSGVPRGSIQSTCEAMINDREACMDGLQKSK